MRTALLAGKPRVITGWRRPTEPSRLPLHAPPLVGLPKQSAVPQIPTAQDQGTYGRCAGETFREVMTGLALRDGLGELLYSANYPYFWARAYDGSPADQDTGTFVETVFTVGIRRGNCRKQTWDDDTSIFDQPNAVADLEAATHKTLLAFSLPNLITMKASIVAGFSFAFGFDVPRQMMTIECAQSGIVEYPDDEQNGWDGGGHAVSAWGYDDDVKIGGFYGAFLCLNHWSKDWGINGRFWLPYHFFETGHATDAHTLRLVQE